MAPGGPVRLPPPRFWAVWPLPSTQGVITDGRKPVGFINLFLHPSG